MVKEIRSLDEFQRETAGPGLVVVDFFTTWCGPCKAIAPFIDSLAAKYPEVKFIKVDIEKNEDIAGPRRISSIPTFHFIVKGQLVDEMKGADPKALEQKVQQHKVDTNPFKDANAQPSTASDAPAKKEAAGTGRTAEQKRQDEADNAAAEAELAAEQASAPQHFQEAPGQQWEEEMVPVPVNEAFLAQLLEMGFSDVRARKSLVHGGSVDGAMAWLAEHQDDPDIDQPYMVRKADTLPKPPMSAEEKAAKLAAIKEKMAQRKAERAKQERAEEIRKEKERRERGQKIDETLEERQRLQRKRDAERLKKEKQEQEKERQRLRAEIAADKERRRANNGVLPSVLGVDGYNPSIIQYDVPAPAGAAAPGASAGAAAAPTVPAKRTNESPTPAASTTAAAPAPAKVPPTKKPTTTASATAAAAAANTSPEARIDSAIQTIIRYRTGGDGGNALKLLLTFVRNVADNPTELKYQSISTESNAFKTKLLPLVGPLILLKAVGFQKGEGADESKLKFEGDPTSPLLRDTVTKLANAEALYWQQNSA